MLNYLLNSLSKSTRNITKYYQMLINYIRKDRSISYVDQWVIDNFYIVSEQSKIIKSELENTRDLRVSQKRKKQIYDLVYEMLSKEKFSITPKTLYSRLNSYQKDKKDYFSYDEIFFVYISIKLSIINQLSDLSVNLKEKFITKHQLNVLFENIEKDLSKTPDIDICKYIKFNKKMLENEFYIEELSYKLNGLGTLSNNLFVKLNGFLNKNGMSLKKLIRNQHGEMTNNNILISNLFKMLRRVYIYGVDGLYDKISFTEKMLESEEANIYESMYKTSKSEYRNKIKEIVRKKQLNEYDYVKGLVEKANKQKKHVGFLLFKEKNNTLVSVIYVFGVSLVSIMLAAFGAYYLGFLSFFMLLVPVYGFVVDTLNQILSRVSKRSTLFRIKIDGNLGKEHSSMVVIPTILKNKEKVEEMFNNLELYYLSNKTDNLYFTLLGDSSSEKTKDAPYDEQVVESGINKVRELNQKYGKNIFYFVYRNRFFNEGENSFLGYERKRGALLQFNSLLLNKLTEEQKMSYFRCHTFNDFDVKIKYVITLDADTKILLNTATKLIGNMIHPMNKPILSKDGMSVVKGYAIMQPKINIDVEVTNKSEYSQLFGGLGGLDSYATRAYDLYQDVFGEGSFVGKGIYDLEIFNKVLENTFPENLILSHDLIEGSYLRCGFVNDAELYDGYPSKYLNDAVRNHRWTRGDWQIISWLKKKVRNKNKKLVKNPISLISKWKIFDNLRRSLTSASLLLFLLYGFSIGPKSPHLYFFIVLLLIIIPIFSYILSKIFERNRQYLILKYYLNLIRGIFVIINKSFVSIILIPYEACLYMDAIIKSLYRMFISKKNLLNWITAEEVEATSKNSISNYVINFKWNYIFSAIILLSSYYFKPESFYVAVAVMMVWLLAPSIMYLLSKDIKKKNMFVNESMKENIKEVAKRTWKFFDDFLTPEDNYLIPDNYQLNRKIRLDYRTSPTNIGFSLVSVISAYELKFIDEKNAIEKIGNIITSVEKLDKWNGHLFNWYNIKDTKPIEPLFISSVDSGNFVGSLYTVLGFVGKNKKYSELKSRIYKLIKNTNFSVLYDSEANLLRGGYDLNNFSFTDFNYDNFLSESRIGSFVAIAKGDIPTKHWFFLNKTLTKHKLYKGVISWSGTMFEYYMPLIFMKTFEHTLLDESYSFAYYVQKEFMKEVDPNLPWGISESGYGELDDSQNYKYKVFGIPYLKIHNVDSSDIVLSPYGSIMAITKYPFAVYTNMSKFKKLNMYDEYGFYESYDAERDEIVKVYYSHHQGMILSSITNYLKSNAIQKYFHADKSIATMEILLKERVQLKPYIDLKLNRYKKFNYRRDTQDVFIKSQSGLCNDPEFGVLSNGAYSIVVNDRGRGFSKYKELQLNRYRNITNEDYGMFLYIKDLNTNKIWTNTYSPMDVVPDRYKTVFSSDSIKFSRHDDDIITNTEVIVSKDYNAEIRKVVIENNSDADVRLELTSYFEPIISSKESDLYSRPFNDITVTAEVDKKTSSLIFKKLQQNTEIFDYYLVNKMFTEDDYNSAFEFETSRLEFLGRNNTTMNPEKVIKSIPLSSKVKLLDPIMSIRKKINIAPHESKTIYLIVGYGKSREQVMEIASVYDDSISMTRTFETNAVFNSMRNRYFNLTSNKLSMYNSILKYLYFSPSNDTRIELLKENNLSQEDLWKFGISGDLPIILVKVDDVEDFGFIQEVLAAYEFFKSRAIYIDIVLTCNDNDSKKKQIETFISNSLFRINNSNFFEDSPGNICLLSNITEEEMKLFELVASASFDPKDYKTLTEEVLNINNSVNNQYEVKKVEKINNKKIGLGEKTEFFNQYGGFINDGKEYAITNINTPMPWSNILANDNFGTVITNSLGGFTYSYNSREFKITAFNGDTIQDPSSETFIINGKKFVPESVVHGFGYSKFKAYTESYNVNMNVFVASKDNIKFYRMDIDNVSLDYNIELKLSINPALGTSSEVTSRYITSHFDEKNNCIVLQNTYNKYFRNQKVFIKASEPIIDYDIDNIIEKYITINLSGKSKYSIFFEIGCNEDIEPLISKYNSLDKLESEYNLVLNGWEEKLSSIKINTPDKSLNYFVNGWLLYQTYSSRLFSRTGFYQVGGAYGFRDQLQDAMGIVYSDPIYARNQILKHAAHQFLEGDVLHWWHEEVMFGARTKFSDDYLWLIYVTYEYLEATNDYSILDEMVPFVEGDLLKDKEKEKGIRYSYSETKKSLYDHMKLALNLALNKLGVHGLPLIGIGDWNDGMNKVGEEGKGESVWLGFFVYDLLNKMKNISKHIEDNKEFVEMCNKYSREMKKSLEDHAWDGKWYIRAFFDNGDTLGSHSNDECKIDLLSQSWSIITDIVDEDKKNVMLKEVESRLIDKENGIIKLLDPPFEKKGNNPGYIGSYISGIRENGAQYTHAAMWYIMALIKAGYADRAYEYYSMINPINRTTNKNDADLYKVEPYVIAADIYSNSNFKGRGGWTWYTGSASWAYKIAVECILGFKKSGDTLTINPSIDSSWKEFNITYKYKDTVYKIHVNNEDNVSSGVKDMIYDGKKVNNINLVDDKVEHTIIVNMGPSND